MNELTTIKTNYELRGRVSVYLSVFKKPGKSHRPLIHSLVHQFIVVLRTTDFVWFSTSTYPKRSFIE